MIEIIQYLLLSIVLIVIGHFVFFFLFDTTDDEEGTPTRIYDMEKRSAEREKIMSHMREEEGEDIQLQEYVKNKLNVLNT